MAYAPGYDQASQRPYHERAAQTRQTLGPALAQGYQQAPGPDDRNLQQQYRQYSREAFAYRDSSDGRSEEWKNGGYQNMHERGRTSGYPTQGQYRSQQHYNDHNEGRGGPSGRGARGPPAAQFQRGPGAGPRGGAFRQGYSAHGEGRPTPTMNDQDWSDPGDRYKDPITPPAVQAWDSPFPTFPGAKKKTSAEEEQQIIEKMTTLNMHAASGRPGIATSNGNQNGYRGGETDDFGYPAFPDRSGSHDDYSQPLESQNEQRDVHQGRGLPSQSSPQHFSDQQRGSQRGWGPPHRQNTYGPDTGSTHYNQFNPPSRSMTMPTALANGPQHRQPMANRNLAPSAAGQAPVAMNTFGSSAPYNGPIGRGFPIRPATATGSRPAPQRVYPSQGPQEQAQNVDENEISYGQQTDSVLDFYDQYYDPRTSQFAGPKPSPMPNFDALPDSTNTLRRRGHSIDAHIRDGSQGPSEVRVASQYKPYQAQPEYQPLPQPQSGVIERVDNLPQLQGYGDQYGQEKQTQGYDVGQDHPRSYPDRTVSQAAGFSNGVKPGPIGLPPGPLLQSLPKLTTPNPNGWPSHPTPVRPGLLPSVSPGMSSQSSHSSNRPPPVRNYDIVSATTPQPERPQLAAPEKVVPPRITPADIELLRSKAKAIPNDRNTQFTLAKKLIEAAEGFVTKISDHKYRNKTREKYLVDAHKILKRLVNSQHVEAMFFLADCYGRGALGLEADDKEAFTLYQNAAKAGHPGAAYRTAVCCELGNEEGGGTRKDPVKAIQWYRRAATLGDTPAMYKMGMIQLKGLLGQSKNPHEAVVWLKRAAERADTENPHALHELALLYEAPTTNESAIQREENYAFELFTHAADLGYKFAQFRLGCAYEYGLLNQTIDPRHSIMWYSRAAVQQEHQSEMALSGWYLTGAENILQQSDTEAYLWARKAAMAGLAKAEYAMGYFTEVGIGAPSNLEDAKRWYWRAAAQNFPKARERLEDLKKAGSKQQLISRERISRSKVGKQNEGECNVM